MPILVPEKLVVVGASQMRSEVRIYDHAGRGVHGSVWVGFSLKRNQTK